MSSYVAVARVDQFTDTDRLAVEVDGRRIGVFRLGDTFYAIDEMCTHADASLCEGDIVGGEVMCPLHMATFDLATGACTGPPATEDVATYPVRVTEDGAIEVAVS